MKLHNHDPHHHPGPFGRRWDRLMSSFARVAMQVNPGVERKSESCRQSVDRTQSSLPTKLLSKVLRKNIKIINTEF